MSRSSLLGTFVGLLAAAPAGADTLDTLTIDPASSTAQTGTATLRPGTRYTMEVSGTFQIVGPEGFGFRHDTLYCYEGVGFDASAGPQCTHTGTHDTSHRSGEIGVGVGTSPMVAPDLYGSASAAGHDTADVVPYDDDHSYRFSFYAPATGKLRAGGYNSYNDCSTCQSHYSGGPVVIKLTGPGSGSGGGGPTTVEPLAVSDGGPTVCVKGQRSVAVAAGKKVCPFGQIAVKAPPPPDTPVDVSSAKLRPKTRSLAGVVRVDDAAVKEESAVLVDLLDYDNGDQKFKDLFEGCLIFGNVEDPVPTIWAMKNARERIVFLVCAHITIANLKGSSSGGARAAASGCKVTWVPIFKPHSHPTRKEYRAAVAEHNRDQKASCQTGSAGIKFSLAARHGTLNRSIGSTARTAFARTSDRADGPNARMAFSWGISGG